MPALLAGAARGQSLETPIVLAVRAYEVTQRPAALDPKAPWDPVDEAFGKLNLDPSQWSEGQRDAVRFASDLQAARNQMESVRADYGRRSDGKRDLGRATEVVEIAVSNLAVPPVVKIAASLARHSAQEESAWTDAKAAAAVADAEKSYRGAVSDGAKAAYARGSAGAGAAFDLSAANAYVDQFMRAPAIQGLPEKERDAVRAQLSDGVQKLRDEQAVVTADNVSEILARQDQLGATVGNLRKDVSTLQTAIESRLDRAASHQEAMRLSVDALTDEVRAGNAQLQYMAWSQMPPAAQLELLKTESFLPKMPNRQAIREQLEKVVDVQKGVELVSQLNDAATVFESLGLPINSRSVNQAASVVTNVASAYLSFVAGGPMGMLSSATSLGRAIGALGGGGADPAKARHEEIMKKLALIEGLQRETIRKIDALSEQLRASTDSLMKRINIGIEYDALAINYLEEVAWSGDFELCRRFRVGALNQLRESGKREWFPSYEDRREYFSPRTAEVAACEKIYITVGSLGAVNDGGSHLHPALWRYQVLRPAASGAEVQQVRSPWDYHSRWFEPMRKLNDVALGVRPKVDGPSASPERSLAAAYCEGRALAQLAASPARLIDARRLSQPCNPGDVSVLTKDQYPQVRAKSLAGGAVTYRGAMEVVAHPTRTLELGQMMLFSLPFNELKDPGANVKALRTANELRTKGVDQARAANQLMYERMAEVVDVAVAQQTALSGALAAPFAVQALRAGNFGYASAPARERERLWRAEVGTHKPATGAPTWWTYPLGMSGVAALPQEFAQPAEPLTTDQKKKLTDLRKASEDVYLDPDDLKQPDRTGLCPVAALQGTDAAARASAVICLMDWHPEFAYNVGLELFRQAVEQGRSQRSLLARWLEGSSRSALAPLLPGLDLLRTGPAGMPMRWGIRLQHPDGRELFLPAPSVMEIEVSRLAYTDVSYSLRELRDTLRDRAAVLSAKDILTSPGETSQQARLRRSVWARDPGYPVFGP